MQLIERIQCH